MRNRVGLILILALVCGGAAAYLAFNFLRGPAGPRLVQASEPTALAVASRVPSPPTESTMSTVSMIRSTGAMVFPDTGRDMRAANSASMKKSSCRASNQATRRSTTGKTAGF